MKASHIFWILFTLYILRTIKKKSFNPMFTEQDAKDAILAVKEKYGIPLAQKVEKIFRLETAHFTSLAYKLTGTAGMEVGKWKDLPQGLKTTTAIDDKAKAGQQEFIIWTPKEFALYLAEYIKRHNGNENRWNAIDPTLQANYAKLLSGVKNRFV